MSLAKLQFYLKMLYCTNKTNVFHQNADRVPIKPIKPIFWTNFEIQTASSSILHQRISKLLQNIGFIGFIGTLSQLWWKILVLLVQYSIFSEKNNFANNIYEFLLLASRFLCSSILPSPSRYIPASLALFLPPSLPPFLLPSLPPSFPPAPLPPSGYKKALGVVDM